MRYTNIAAIIDVLSRNELPLLDPTSWDDRNDRHFMNLYRGFIGAEVVYAACCTLSNETYHHWRVFGGRNGAYLEFERAELERHLSTLVDTGHPITFKQVSYFTLDRIEMGRLKPGDLPFAKRWGFQAEREYRIIAEGTASQLTYPIPLPVRLIRKVVVNPWLTKDVYESVKASMRKIDGCSKLDVGRSHLIDNTRWKVAGIKAVAAAHRKSYAFGNLRTNKAMKK